MFIKTMINTQFKKINRMIKAIKEINRLTALESLMSSCGLSSYLLTVVIWSIAANVHC